MRRVKIASSLRELRGDLLAFSLQVNRPSILVFGLNLPLGSDSIERTCNPPSASFQVNEFCKIELFQNISLCLVFVAQSLPGQQRKCHEDQSAADVCGQGGTETPDDPVR